MTRRTAFYVGALCLLALGGYLIWLWQPATQVEKHSQHLIDAIANKNWPKFAAFVAENYHDQWQNDRAAVVERTREVCRYARGLRLTAVAPAVDVQATSADWRARIVIEGAPDDEVIAALKAHVNVLTTPFELEWRRMSAKPWDWTLVGVRNRQLRLPSGL
ncbi:MAG: hypothetical protein ACJ8M1_03730 [Chthoniobacterales bacterium]